MRLRALFSAIARSMRVDRWFELHGPGGALYGQAGRSGGPSDPYEQLVAFFRCVQFLSRNVASMPLCVKTADDRLIESGPIAELLDRPNPTMSIETFVEQTLGWLYAGDGVAYWYFATRRGKRPTSIVPLGSLNCRPRYANPSNRGEPIGYLVRPPGVEWSRATPVELDEVWPMRIAAYDGDRPARGVSVAGVARRAINQVYKADVANEASLDNGVEPGGVIRLPGTPTEEQMQAWRSKLAERQGAGQRRLPFFLYDGAEWERTQAAFSEMEFKDLKLLSRDDVCAAFGVDPAAVGFPPAGGRFEYAESAKRGAWLDTVLPTAGWLAGQFDRGVLSHYETDESMAMSRSLKADAARRLRAPELAVSRMTSTRSPRSPRRLTAYFDATGVRAVADLMDSRTEAAGRMVRELKATPAAACELFGLGVEIVPAMRVSWQSATEFPVDLSRGFADDDPTGAEPPEDGGFDGDGGAEGDDTDGAFGRRIDDRSTAIRALLDAASKDDDEGDDPDSVDALFRGRLKAIPEAQRDAYWRAWRATHSGYEPRFRRLYRDHVFGLRNAVLDNLDRLDPAIERTLDDGPQDRVDYHWHALDPEIGERPLYRSFFFTPVQRDLLGQLLFDVVAQSRELLRSLDPLVTATFTRGGESVMAEVTANGDDPSPFDLADPAAESALRARRQSITDIDDRIARRLRVRLAEALEAGTPMAELREVVREGLGVEANRAKTIAFQELSSSVEAGRAVAREQAGIPLKSWLWSRRETGRPSHARTERYYLDHPIPNDQRFEIGGPGGSGVLCDHPRATGRASEDINCGCTVLSRFDGDSVGRAVARSIAALESVTKDTPPGATQR